MTPLRWSEWPEAARRIFHGFPSETGEELIMTKNVLVEAAWFEPIQQSMSGSK